MVYSITTLYKTVVAAGCVGQMCGVAGGRPGRWRGGGREMVAGPGHNTVLHSTAATLHTVGGKFVDKTGLAVGPATLSTPLTAAAQRSDCVLPSIKVRDSWTSSTAASTAA